MGPAAAPIEANAAAPPATMGDLAQPHHASRGTPRGPPPGFRARRLPRRAARNRAARGRRRRRAGADADGRRQVAVLPVAGAAAGRHRGGRLAADRADAGPGRRARAARRAGGVPQLDARRRRGARRGARPGRRRARPALRRTRAAGHAALPRTARPHAGGALRHRRGALRLAVGPRLPARVPAALGAARALPGRPEDRPHRHGRSPDPRRDRRAPVARGRARVRLELRPPEHPLHDRRQARRARAAAAVHPRPSRGRGRHRLLPVAPAGGRNGRMAAGPGRVRARIPCRPRRRDPCRPAGALPARGRHRHGGHDRLRHGHRQARRALRRAPRPAEEHRGLLPGDRPGRARRPPRGRLDGLRPRRRGAAAADDRGLRVRRGAQARREREARCAARAVRDGTVPPRTPARLLRRGERHPAATATPASSRRRPGMPASPRRRRSRRSTARASASAPCISSTCCAARRPSGWCAGTTSGSACSASAPSSTRPRGAT